MSVHHSPSYIEHLNTIQEFKNKVQELTRQAVCGRSFVLVESLKKWLRGHIHPERGSESPTHAGRLLAAVYRDRQEPGEDITVEHLCARGKGECLLVFCILVELDRGELIHRFWRKDMIHLPIDLLTLRGKINQMRIRNSHGLAEQFDEKQWSYCPMRFEYELSRDLESGHIVPIIRKKEINKGGTSEVWEIDVYEEFVDEALRQAVFTSRYQVTGENCYRYHFALKIFNDGYRSTYENEKKAFQGLKQHEGMVKYLGDYWHPREKQMRRASAVTIQPESVRSTTNMLLEFADMDLHEFFLERLPPILEFEVTDFWLAIFEVADALEGIHNLKFRKDELSQEFHGWHADIKPDNILSVHGKFKLADPGFATFVAKNGEKDPKAVLMGNTSTYAAPECRRDRVRESLSGVPQTIDTWSLGCVFAVAASWVVLGSQGIALFSTVRKKNINRIIESQPDVENDPEADRPPLTRGDYFHDGHKVLPDVQGWFQFLRSTLRKTDKVTDRVLSLVERGMLVDNPNVRMKAEKVCEELNSIKESLEFSSDGIPDSILETLCQIDHEASSKHSTTVPTQSASNHTETPTITISKKRKTANERLLDLPLMKTAHRSKLRSELYQKSTAYQVIPSEPVPKQVRTNTRSARRGSQFIPAGDTPPVPEVEYEEVRVVTPPANPESKPTLPGTASLTRRRTERKVTDPTKLAEIPYKNVFQARDEVERREKDVNQVISAFSSRYSEKAQDPLLSGHFKGRRDIIFLVDNASTMLDYWYEATYVLETIIMKTKGLDLNGMDLFFTLRGKEIKDEKNKKAFITNMNKAQPIETGGLTDMRESLSRILNSYLKNVQLHRTNPEAAKNLTIFVLTDGIWAGTVNKTDIEDEIVDFLKALGATKLDIRNRPVSIQFIQFGHDSEATLRLRQLDNFSKWKGIPDIIDTEHSSGNINKMILGSFVPSFDQVDEYYDDTAGSSQSPSQEVSPTANRSIPHVTMREPVHSLASPLDGVPLSLHDSPEHIDPFHPPPTERLQSMSVMSTESHNRGPIPKPQIAYQSEKSIEKKRTI